MVRYLMERFSWMVHFNKLNINKDWGLASEYHQDEGNKNSKIDRDRSLKKWGSAQRKLMELNSNLNEIDCGE